MTTCDKIKERLSAYVDQETDAAQTREVAAHLEQCPPCAEAASAEQAMKTLVQTRAQNVSAPPQLRARIRRELAQLDEGSGFWRLVREVFQLHPLPAFATLATLVLATSALTFFGGNTFARVGDPIAYEASARLEGSLVCADCQLMMATSTPCVHEAGTHRMALKCKDGSLWNIVQSAPGRELLQGLGAAQLVQTEGYVFRRAGYIQVTNYKILQN